MEIDGKMTTEHASFLDTLPPVDFCCVYGSSLHASNVSKASMVDCILGVNDPLKWHSENLKINRDHYASLIVRFGGAQLITKIADNVGVGVHFSPFISHRDSVFKFGVVRMHDLIQDILGWKSFYLSGRLHKPVNVIFDKMEIKELNSINLKAAAAAALLLLPAKFSEEELYAQICSLSYMGDLRMLFAEDKNKVKKIVQGQFKLLQAMYLPCLEEFAAKNILRESSSIDRKVSMTQDRGTSSTDSLVSYLPLPIRNQLATFLECGEVRRTREQCADSFRKIIRRKVKVSSARQGLAGLLTVGAVGGLRYVGSKIHKAWRSIR